MDSPEAPDLRKVLLSQHKSGKELREIILDHIVIVPSTHTGSNQPGGECGHNKDHKRFLRLLALSRPRERIKYALLLEETLLRKMSLFSKFYDYDTGARGFSKLGKMYFVEADYSISVDELGAARNKCEPLLVGIYDECAVKEASKYVVAGNKFAPYASVLFPAQDGHVERDTMHCSLDSISPHLQRLLLQRHWRDSCRKTVRIYT